MELKKGLPKVALSPFPLTAFAVRLAAGLWGDRTVYIGTFAAEPRNRAARRRW